MLSTAVGWDTLPYWKWGSRENYILEKEVPSPLPYLAPGMPGREWRHLFWTNRPQRKDL